MDQVADKTLDELVFDNRFVRQLPADRQTENYRRQVMGACYSRVQPTKVAQPQLVAYAREVAQLLELSDEACNSEEFAQVFAGNRLLAGMDPIAHCYGGHQFGNWAGQLGDGRAINLGEVVNRHQQRWTLQLKGAGPTPYSRQGDGLAVMRSSVREFLCSEAMHHLGVPTTRALSLVATGEEVVRDMFYDGNPKAEPGAIVCRVAPSFSRFGNFQLFTSRGEKELLQRLVDYTICTDFADLGKPSPAVYPEFFAQVCRITAKMMVHWMRVGFVHGVMNTDNMSILGLTIDYGPYGWLEDYDPDWTPNTTDATGRRYRFGNQPSVAQWNLAQLGNALFPLTEEVEPLQAGLDLYVETYKRGWQEMMAQKLGLNGFDAGTDTPFISELEEILQLAETDMTLFYRKLALVDAEDGDGRMKKNEDLMAPLVGAYYQVESLNEAQQARIGAWLRAYIDRVRRDGTDNQTRRQRMDRVNPKYVLRNYLAQLAIDKAEVGDYSLVNQLLDVLRRPYDEQPGQEEFAAKRPDWARQRPGCSMLSCSS